MIECRSITKQYGDGDHAVTVLQDVSFHVDAGEFVAIMGPSGSGKSTLMHILGALDTPTSGSYSLDGHDVSTLTDDELTAVRNRSIGFVFQAFNLLARTSVIRNVMLPLVYARVPRRERVARAEAALAQAGFPESHQHRLPNELSGGQMQRVAIARALVTNPAIILADEPTGNLDSATGAIVLRTFQELHRTFHRSIMLITHERDVAEHAERILTLRDGKLIQDERRPVSV